MNTARRSFLGALFGFGCSAAVVDTNTMADVTTRFAPLKPLLLTGTFKWGAPQINPSEEIVKKKITETLRQQRQPPIFTTPGMAILDTRRVLLAEF